MANNFELKSSIDYSKIDKMAKDQEILIGYPAGMPHANGDTLDEIAKKLTYGAGPQSWTRTKRVKGKNVTTKHSVTGIPARPFLEEGIMDGKDEITRQIEAHYKAQAEGTDSTTTIHRIAVAAVGAIKRFVMGDYYRSNVPNSQETIDAKGSDKPLIDTGQLVNAITYVVNDKAFGKVKNQSTGKKEWTEIF